MERKYSIRMMEQAVRGLRLVPIIAMMLQSGTSSLVASDLPAIERAIQSVRQAREKTRDKGLRGELKQLRDALQEAHKLIERGKHIEPAAAIEAARRELSRLTEATRGESEEVQSRVSQARSAVEEAWDPFVRSEFAAAKRDNRIHDYEAFLRRHPDHALAKDAQRRLIELRWNAAKSADTLVGYTDFLATHSESDFATEAKTAIETLERKQKARKEAKTICITGAAGVGPGGSMPHLVNQIVEGLRTRIEEAGYRVVPPAAATAFDLEVRIGLRRGLAIVYSEPPAGFSTSAWTHHLGSTIELYCTVTHPTLGDLDSASWEIFPTTVLLPGPPNVAVYDDAAAKLDGSIRLPKIGAPIVAYLRQEVPMGRIAQIGKETLDAMRLVVGDAGGAVTVSRETVNSRTRGAMSHDGTRFVLMEITREGTTVTLKGVRPSTAGAGEPVEFPKLLDTGHFLSNIGDTIRHVPSRTRIDDALASLVGQLARREGLTTASLDAAVLNGNQPRIWVRKQAGQLAFFFISQGLLERAGGAHEGTIEKLRDLFVEALRRS